MPEWLVLLLVLVFTVHLAIFLRLAVRRRRKTLYLISLTFLLLAASFSARLLWPRLGFWGHSLHIYLRMLAWTCTLIVICLALLRKLRARQAR